MKFRVNEYKLESQKLNHNRDILHISDIHSNICALKNIKYLLTDKITDIMVTGDTLDYIEAKENKDILKEFKTLSQYANVIVSLGNHDGISLTEKGLRKIKVSTNDLSFFKQLNEETDCIVMDDDINQYYFNSDSNIAVSAINMPRAWYLDGEDKEVFNKRLLLLSEMLNKDRFNILFSHTPNVFIKDDQLQIDNDINLILSGHNHGGLTPMFIQNLSKKHTGLVGPYGGFLEHNAFGYWTNDDTSLILSNGITKIANSSKLSLISTAINTFFIPDVELIHLTPSDNHNLQLQKRKIHNIK